MKKSGLVAVNLDSYNANVTDPSISYSFEMFFGYWMGFHIVTLVLLKYQSRLDGYCDSENNLQSLIALTWGFILISSLIISLINPFRNLSINFSWKSAFLSSLLRFIYIVVLFHITIYISPLFNDPCPYERF